MPRKKSSKRPKLAREGFVGRLAYFVERAFINIKQNVFLNVMTIGTISLAFLILALFILVFVNLERVAESWSERVQVAVYFEKELSPGEVDDISRKIRAIPGAAHVQYISKGEALKRFSGSLKGQESLLEGVSADILPSSFEIRLARNSRDSEAVAGFASRLKQVPGVSEVQYGEEWVQRFSDFMFLLKFAGTLVTGFIVLAVVFIVANTVKLTIYARKDEVELMGLVGATRMFIKAPFLIEGFIQGLLGSSVAIVILSGAYVAFLRNSEFLFSFSPIGAGLQFLPFPCIVYLIGGGAVLGFLGSLASLKRFVSL